MSFLDRQERQFIWIAAPLQSSALRTPGCVQCGSRLDEPAAELTGKCFNCALGISEDDEVFEELDG